MAKKAASGVGDRQDPKKNKSLAIRTVLASMPNAKAADVVAAVKKEYGHDISQNRVYMIKTKRNMAAARGKSNRKPGRPAGGQLSSAHQWVGAIKLAKELLQATGSVSNATALLNAVAG